jgi:small subunit ribosomal protein S8
MAVTDPIGDMLTIIRNGSSSGKDVVEVKNSRVSGEFLRILKAEGFIANYKLIKDKKQGLLRIYLRYAKAGTPAITGLRRISKPGLRIYKRLDEVPSVYGGLGIAVVSTSKGIMTDREAREKNLGGEVLCYAW